MTTIVCAGCGWTAPPLDARPFRCPRAGTDDTDHVLVRKCSWTAASAADGAALLRPPDDAGEAPANQPAGRRRSTDQPFVRYRRLTHAWHTAMQIGMSDEEFVAMVLDLDERVGGLRVTPLAFRDGLWIKDETHNPGGSHKIRHLFGLMVWLLVAERIDRAIAKQRLAIASCGNAALAAAIVAHAASRALDVFVPHDADDAIVERLQELGATVTHCSHEMQRLREAVQNGAIPFTCQGNENGLAIEGGQTIGWEIAESGVKLDALFIQVGGGALASAVIAGLSELHAHMPRIHAVQTLASPLLRAWERVLELGFDVTHRSAYMWPWEPAPHSIATGILDEETYDWAAVVRGMLATGGWPVVVTEEQLRDAQRIAGAGVSATGAAGLAGVLAARPDDEAVGVIFTGATHDR